MAALTDTTIASTYKQLLKLTSEGVSADASAKYVEDGLGTDTALSLSTTRVGIGTTSPASLLHISSSSAAFIASSWGSTEGSNVKRWDWWINDKRLFLQDKTNGAYRLAILDNGNVGIGTTSPDYELDVESSGEADIRAIGGTQARLILTDTGGTSGARNWDIKVSDDVFQIRNLADDYGSIENTPFTATTSGKVGIGDSSPDTALKVEYSNNDNWVTRLVNTHAGGWGLKIEAGDSANEYAFKIDDYDEANVLHWVKSDGTTHYKGPIGIGDSTPTTGIVCITSGSGSNTVKQADHTALIINDLWGWQLLGTDGDVGLGQYKVQAGTGHWMYKQGRGHDNSNDFHKWYTADTERFSIASGGIITAGGHLLAGGAFIPGSTTEVDAQKIYDQSSGSGSNTLYIGNQTITTSSDRRIKKNIKDTKINATETLNQLRVVDFEWDDPTDVVWNNKNARVSQGGQWTGLVAQEAVEVVPHIINAPRIEETLEIDEDSEQRWNIEYGSLVPTLIKAVQELSAKVEELKTELQDTKDYVDHKQDYNSLAGRINSCEARIGNLEKK